VLPFRMGARHFSDPVVSGLIGLADLRAHWIRAEGSFRREDGGYLSSLKVRGSFYLMFEGTA